MATFETMKKSLEVLEKNVKVSKSLLGAKVDSLDEMKRNRQEAENDEDRRELKIAIESLENIIDKDRVAVADLEASYKDLKEEVDKAEAEKGLGRPRGMSLVPRLLYLTIWTVLQQPTSGMRREKGPSPRRSLRLRC